MATKQNMYALSEAQIETLASERTQSLVTTDKYDGTYLRAIVAGVQSLLGPKRGKSPGIQAQLEALETVAAPYYAAVLRGVITSDIELDASLEAAEVTKRTRERTRRATFARTAKSTLVSWVSEGGDIRALEVSVVTKTELRTAVTAARSERAPTSDRIERAQATILAAVAREGPEEARLHLAAVIGALQEVLDGLEEEEPHHDTTTIRTRVGAVSFREPARVLNRGAGA
jgi:hypothetical protein